MDEETEESSLGSTTDPEPGSSKVATKISKKKAAPVKKKAADKENAPSKKAKKEAAPAKKADKVAEPAKANKDKESAKKASKVEAPSNINKDKESAKKPGKVAAPSKANKDKESAKKPGKVAAPSNTNKDKESAKKATKGAIPAWPSIEKKTTLDLVCEAIQVLGESRKGLSVQAIKKYVKSKQADEFANFKYVFNRALSKGIEKGILVRPPVSKDVTGAVGYFRLAKVVPSKRIKVPKGKTDSEHASDSEATEKPVKPRKRNLSDTYIAEMRASTPKPSVKDIAAPKVIKRVKKIPKKNTNDKKETSDSEVVVKKTKRKSMKSYSSDTEVDFKESKIPKSVKPPLKKVASDKSKAGPDSKVSKSKLKKL